jgi:hypothetical protein
MVLSGFFISKLSWRWAFHSSEIVNLAVFAGAWWGLPRDKIHEGVTLKTVWRQIDWLARPWYLFHWGCSFMFLRMPLRWVWLIQDCGGFAGEFCGGCTDYIYGSCDGAVSWVFGVGEAAGKVGKAMHYATGSMEESVFCSGLCGCVSCMGSIQRGAIFYYPDVHLNVDFSNSGSKRYNTCRLQRLRFTSSHVSSLAR